MGNFFTKCIQSKYKLKKTKIKKSNLFLCNISAKDVDFEGEPWPVTDDEGYYQSYKENGKFVNWWHKDMPNAQRNLVRRMEFEQPGLDMLQFWLKLTGQ